MTFAEMVAEVQNIIQDAFWTETKIKALINQAYNIVAKGIIMEQDGKKIVTPPLPDLYTTGVLAATNAGAGVVAMPVDFDRDLIQVVNASSQNVAIDYSFKRFLLKNFAKDAGSVTTCSRHGTNFYYRDIPADTENLTIHYYKAPTALSADGDEPDELPEGLHRPIFVGYACSEIFKQIEDGVEGQKISSVFWANEFRLGLLENLALIVGHDSGPNNYDISGSTK